MKAWTPLLALVVFAGQTAAAEIDKAKLRKLAEQLASLPFCDTFRYSIVFSSSEGFKLYSEKTESPVLQIDRVRKELKDDDTDAERYLRLAVLYLKVKDEKASNDAGSRAIDMFRRQVQKYPHDMHRLAQLGDALCCNGEIKEGEAILRRAVKEAPNDWHTWIMLGKCLDDRATQIIWGDEKVPFHSSHHEIKSLKPFTKKPSAEQIKKMRELWQKARRCYDRAIELAPGEKEPYCQRVGALGWHGMCEAKLRNDQVKQDDGIVPFVSIVIEDCLADNRQIARFSPNDPASVGGAVLAELMFCLEANRKTNERMGWFADPLPQPSRDFVRWGIGRLEELAKSEDRRSAAAASEILAQVLFQKMICEVERMDREEEMERREGSPGSAEKSGTIIKEGLGQASMCLKALAGQRQIERHFLRAVQLDPTRENAWAGLMMFFPALTGFDEALATCEKLIKTQDNSRVRFFLAISCAQKQQFDKAANHLRQGIAMDKDDLNCRLTLAALQLRSNDAEALKEIGKQLDSLRSRIQQAKSNQRIRCYNLLVGLCAALNNQPDRAKEWLQSILWPDMRIKNLEKTMALEALAALAMPATPADESLAIAYLNVGNDKIQREDKRPDSPILKVRLTLDNIGDEDLYFLSAFSQLRDLRLSSIQITDAGLVHLEHIPTLRHLYLNSREITDAGLTHLHKLKQLESVDLHGTKVTDKGIAELRKVFPKIDISR
ncbi:MAG TPA: hypothetical protein VH592_25595 [Gemmataceae bacterium]